MSEYYYTLEQLLRAAQKLIGIVSEEIEEENIFVDNALINVNNALDNLGYSYLQQANLDYQLIIDYLSDNFEDEPSENEDLGNYPIN